MYATFHGSDVDSVKLPSGVISIRYCFAHCDWIQSVNIPSSVKYAERAFESSSLKSITFPPTSLNIYLTNVIGDCSKLEEIRFLGPIPNISYPDPDRYNLTTVALTTNEGWHNLPYDKLSKVIFLNGYNETEATSWKDWSKLEYFVVSDNTPPTISDSFSEAQKWNIKIRVPSSALDAYKQAPVWKDFFFLAGGAETLGIDNIDADANIGNSETAKNTYNLNGVKVTEMLPGHIYIRNGKKFIAK